MKKKASIMKKDESIDIRMKALCVLKKEEKKCTNKRMDKYVNALKALQSENPETLKYDLALENYKLVFWKTAEEILGRYYPLFWSLSQNYKITVQECIDVVQFQLYEKHTYYMNMENAKQSYVQLVQKSRWLVCDLYKKTVAANTVRIKKHVKDVDKKSKGETGKEEAGKAEAGKKNWELNASYFSLNDATDDGDGMNNSELIVDENAVDPESNILFELLCEHLLTVILANSSSVTNIQLICWLNFLIGNDNEQLIDLVNDSKDSCEIMRRISDLFAERFGFTSSQLARLNLDIPKTLSYKSVANRTSEAKRIINTILEADPFIDGYLKEYFLGKYAKG